MAVPLGGVVTRTTKRKSHCKSRPHKTKVGARPHCCHRRVRHCRVRMQQQLQVVEAASRTLHEMREGMRHPARRRRKTQDPGSPQRNLGHPQGFLIVGRKGAQPEWLCHLVAWWRVRQKENKPKTHPHKPRVGHPLRAVTSGSWRAARKEEEETPIVARGI
jgi:hypothetical protein